MEAVVLEDSPLADYLEGERRSDPDLPRPEELTSAAGEAGDTGKRTSVHDGDHSSSSESSSPSFAPRGQPRVKARFRNKPPPLRLRVPGNETVAAIHKKCSGALTARLGRAENAKFLERFRYTIVASQLLNTQSVLGSGTHYPRESDLPALDVPQSSTLHLPGLVITASCAFFFAWTIHWVRANGGFRLSNGRFVIATITIALLAALSSAYMRRQWLLYVRRQALTEVSNFVSQAQDFDSVAGGALALVQEVELVSRGSTPLPPISRLEDRGQTRRCARLRKALRLSLTEVIPRYKESCILLQPLTEELDLEKYYDIYDITNTDYSEAMLGYAVEEFDDFESLRVLKILAARFHTMRKVLLCCLMALEAYGGKSDFTRWSTAVDIIRNVVSTTRDAEHRLRSILTEEENFPIPPTPKAPLTPGRERWRAQLRKLNSLSSGIRGLQAKLHVIRDESDKTLHESDDITEIGTNLMVQYESIGVDLRELMREWEDGKAALASNIDRNERRISSMSGMLSPTTSLGGLTAVEEGSALDALKALNGESRSRSSMEFSCSDAEEVFEAVAIPKQRSSMTREERIFKMREERAKRESMKDKREANTNMLRELESVINLRPRLRQAPGARVTSI